MSLPSREGPGGLRRPPLQKWPLQTSERAASLRPLLKLRFFRVYFAPGALGAGAGAEGASGGGAGTPDLTL